MAADTKYVVLRKTDDGWVKVATVVAASAKNVVLEAAKADDLPDEGATFVAVPERSWKPVTVKATQTITLKVDEPEPS